MSGVFGVCDLDGAPPDPGLLHRMSAFLAERGPDREGLWSCAGVSLGHRLLVTTPEAVGERQPLADASGAVCLTMDGRIDNREELRRDLEAHGFAPRDATDAELALRAYEAWGEDCAPRLLGDFALAVWDGRRRRLFCARDRVGIRPFYYASKGPRLVFASEIRAVLKDRSVSPEPNEGMVGEYLAADIRSQDETLYRDIRRLPPAHVLVFEARGLSVRRYWDIDPERLVRHASDVEYGEHFLEVLGEAIRCRLRSHGPPAITVSGGLDSTSIAAIALARYPAESSGAGFYHLAYPDSPADELEFVRSAEQAWGRPVTRVRAPRATADTLPGEARRYRDFPDFPSLSPWGALIEEARRRGSRVLIQGVGGDQWLNGSESHCGDLLREFRIPEFLRQWRGNVRIRRGWGDDRIGRLSMLGRSMAYALPVPVVRMIAGRRNSRIPEWIRPDFAERSDLRTRLRPVPQRPGLRYLSQSRFHSLLRSGWSAVELEILDRFESALGIEGRDPFLDARVIEFALALPERQRRQGPWCKYVLRTATKDLLPESVRTRLSKGDASHLFVEAMKAGGGPEAYNSLDSALEKWIVVPEVRRIFEQMIRLADSGDPWYCQYIYPLWMVLGINAWAACRTTPEG